MQEKQHLHDVTSGCTAHSHLERACRKASPPHLQPAGEAAYSPSRPETVVHLPLGAKCQARLSVFTAEWKQSERGSLLKVTEKLFKHPVIML